MTVPILELSNVTHIAGATTILNDVSWEVRPGDHWALLGPNGSGKTTLLRIATGLLWPNAGGTILRLGKQLLDLRTLRRSIGWVTQAIVAEVPPSEQALDTVVSGRLAQIGLKLFPDCTPTTDDYSMAWHQLELLGCTNLAEKSFGVLSQGEKQAVLVARARMAEPMLIVLDECCAGMDPGVRERFLEQLNTWLSQADTPSIVFVTHHMEEIVPTITQTLVLDKGCVVACGATQDAITKETMTSLYRVVVHDIHRHAGRYWPVFGPLR